MKHLLEASDLHQLNDPLEDYDLDHINSGGDYLSGISYYERQPYEGDGLAAFLRTRDGKVDVYCLSHCSCFGPLERSGMTTWSGSLEKFLTLDDMDDCVEGRRRVPEDYSYKWWREIVGKAKEVWA